MKSRIYMYLFFFSILLVLFMYVNQSSIFERQVAVISALEKKKVRRKGVHAKTKTSKVKSSKYYQKKYRGQGR